MKYFFTTLLFLVALAGATSAAKIRYVKAGSSSKGSGSSWGDASNDLQAMINTSGAGDEVWVAAGTYKPNRPANDINNISAASRDNAFVMKAGVKLYGGFPAAATTGTGMKSRDWRRYPTVLSGDLNGDDTPGNLLANKANNAYHVVVAAGRMVSGADTACLDGFVITGGYTGNFDKILVNGLNVNKNYGSGIYSTGTAMRFANDSVVGNYGNLYGGGIFTTDDTSTYANVTVCANTSLDGGGVYVNGGSPAFIGALISGNAAHSSGGGVYVSYGTPTFTNATIAGNYANLDVGGVYRNDGTVTLHNSIVGSNNTPGSSKNIFGDSRSSGNYSAMHSIVHGGGVAGIGVITRDPLFVAPKIAGNNNPVAGGSYRLQLRSPAIDGGSGSLNGATADLDGNPRAQGCAVDMGAYESPYRDSLGGANGIVYVSVNGRGRMDGSSWDNAYPGLAYPLYLARLQQGCGNSIKEIWVSKGTYTPLYTSVFSAERCNVTFAMCPGVKLYGGFPADATDGVGMASRNWRANPTVLSGDLNGDDPVLAAPPTASTSKKADNAYHVVMAPAGSMVSGADTACLDGFVITGGYANRGGNSMMVNGQIVGGDYGGGIYSAGAAMRFANDSVVGNYGGTRGGGVYVIDGALDFVNVRVSRNASNYGGGVCCNGGAPAFTNCTISRNTAFDSGGGIDVSGGAPAFTNSTISSNTAFHYGGGMGVGGGAPAFTNTIISGNTVTLNNGGGVYTSKGDLAFTNVLISGNTAGENGGGVYIMGGTLTFTNATIAGNYAKTDGGGVEESSGTITFRNSIVGSNNSDGNSKNVVGSYNVSYSLLQGGGSTDVGVITDDPLFVAPDVAGPGTPSTGGNYRLQLLSAAVDAGSNSLNSAATDLDGNPRAHGCAVDMGAYESSHRDSLGSANGVVYVSVGGKGSKDGSSWDNAFPDLAYPLHLARWPSGCGDNIKEIWVSKGRYMPLYRAAGASNSRDVAFVMAPGVKLYGGFPANALAGTGMASRDWRANPTVLSGDLNNNDIPGDLSTNKADNAYHVVVAAGSMIKNKDTACLDGFVVTGGYADSSSSSIPVNGRLVYRAYGGGIYSAGTAMRFANDSVVGSYGGTYGGGIYAIVDKSTYANVAVSGNSAGSYGGGVYVNSGAPAFTNLLVSGNTGSQGGGGVYVSNTSSTFTNATISKNTASSSNGKGGGVHVSSESLAAFTNVRVSGNTSGGGGGGVYVNNSTPTFTNTLISGNISGHGGGVYVDNGTPAFTNATVAGNYAGVDVGGVYRYDNNGAIAFYNSIVGGNNTPGSNKNIAGGGFSASYSLLQGGGATGTGFIVNDPLFVAPDTAKAGAPADGGDYRLQLTSPAIDAGRSPNSSATDLDGKPRVHGCAVDMGAYESSHRNSLGSANGVVYVSVGGKGRKDGSSWDNAYPDLAYPLHFAQLQQGCGSSVKEIWVSEGRYTPKYTLASSTNSHDAAFTMKAGVKLYGGFPANLSDGAGMKLRNWRRHPTVLSGDLNSNDIPGDLSTNKADNAYHVVVVAGSMIKDKDTACLDGFVLTGGYADGSSRVSINKQGVDRTSGGGIFSTTTAMRFANDSVTGCYGSSSGGGIYAYADKSTYANVAVSGNASGKNGGGVYISGTGALAFTNVLISGNTSAAYGGGVFINNAASIFTNATVAGNHAATNGGGMYGDGGTVTLNNSIVGSNNTSGASKNIGASGSVYSASYSLLHGSSVAGVGVILNAAPLFVAPDTAKAGAPATGGSYRLQPVSPVIDAGSNDLSSAATDLDGNPRVRGCAVDMGAYESSYRNFLSNAGRVVYVSAGGRGRKDGSSWDNAFPDLAFPLHLAQSQPGCGDNIKEIWISEGTYTPLYPPVFSANRRDAAFAMKAGVKLYGGFPANAPAGAGMALRNWRANPTVLSGDLNSDDSVLTAPTTTSSASSKNDNAYHVVIAAGSMIKDKDTACLDGFVVTGGYANVSNSSITVNSRSVDKNSGGGIYSAGTAMRFANDSVAGGYGSGGGGGIYATADTSTYANVAVCGNTAGSSGGGVYVGNGAPAFTNARVSGNTADSSGGGVYVGGGAPAFTNATVAGNYAKTDGGGVWGNGGAATISNSIVGSNNAGGGNKNIGGSSYSATYSLLHGGNVAGVGVITNAAPLFVAPDTAKSGAPVSGGDYRLQLLSPAVDAGSNSLNGTNKDLGGNPRVGAGKIDMGAYELQAVELHITGATLAKKIYDGTDIIEVKNATLGYSDEAVAGKLTFGVEYTAVGKIVSPSPAAAGANSTVAVTVRILPTLLPPERYTFPDTTFTLYNVAVVERRPITVAADSQTKTYGDADPKLTWRSTSGSLAGSDTLAGSLKHAGVATGRYAIVEDTPLANPNYLVTYVEDSITITPAQLTVTPNGGQRKVYGEADPDFAFTVSGWKYSDEDDSVRIITGALSRAAGDTAGVYAITQGNLSAGSSYDVNFIPNVMFEIVRLRLTVSGIEVNTVKVYDGSDSAHVIAAGYFANKVGNDNVALLVTAKYDSKSAGESKTIKVACAIAGADTGSYVAPDTLTFTVLGKITAKQLTVSGTSVQKEKVYDRSDSAYVTSAGAIDSVVGGDNVTLSATAKYDSSSVGIGKTIIVAYSLTGADAGSYVTPSDTTYRDGKITAKPLTVSGTVVAKEKSYDGNDSARIISIGDFNGVVGGDNVMLSATAKYDSSSVGESKTIAVAYSLVGADVGSYVTPSDTTYRDGKITAKPLTLLSTMVIKEKAYDGNNSAHINYSAGILGGVVRNDDVKLLATAKYDDKLVGEGKTIAVTYSLIGTRTDSYIAPGDTTYGDGKITARPLTASGTVVVTEKVYDGSDSARITSAGTLGGVVSGDDVTLSATAQYNNRSVGEGKTITVTYSLAGANAGSYIAPIDTTYGDGKITTTADSTPNAGDAGDLIQTILIVNDKDSVLMRWDRDSISDVLHYRLPCNGEKSFLDQLKVKYTLVSSSNVAINMQPAGIAHPIRRIFTTELTGGQNKRYTVIVEKPFRLFEVINEHIGYLRVVNNNPATNKHGLKFSTCEWWNKRDSGEWVTGELTRLYYAAGPSVRNKFTERDSMYVVLHTAGGELLKTCPDANHTVYGGSGVSKLSADLSVYPNPVAAGGIIRLKQAELFNSENELYARFYLLDAQGRPVFAGNASVLRSGLTMPEIPGVYHFVLEGKAGRKVVKVAVGQREN
jgi:hypothetical protein